MGNSSARYIDPMSIQGLSGLFLRVAWDFEGLKFQHLAMQVGMCTDCVVRFVASVDLIASLQ